MSEHWSKKLPRNQVAWDNTSLSLYKACAYKYKLAMLEGWRKKAEKPALDFGIWFHEAIESYDRARAAGVAHNLALRAAVHGALKNSSFWDRPKDEPPILRFWQGDGKNRTRYTLIRTIIWYCENFNEDALKTLILPDGKPAIELAFRMELGISNAAGEPYIYSGHIDKIATMGEGNFLVERKHTIQTVGSYYFEPYEMAAQVTGYCAAGKMVFHVPILGAIIDAAQVAVGFSRFQRGMTSRHDDRVEEWLEHTQWWVRQAEQSAAQDYWPQNTESCRQFGGCQFLAICSKPRSMRKTFLQTDFEIRPWEPLKEKPVV